MLPSLWHGLAKQIHRHQAAKRDRFRERLGHSSIPRPSGRVIWVHAESVGEVSTVASLLHDIAEHGHIVITTTTQSGAERVESLGSERILHQFKPADTPVAIGRFLDHWRPRAAVFVESDMPPVALSILRQRGIARALLAARPSGTRRRAPKIAAALLAEFDLVTASSQSVADELEGLKVKVHHVEDLKAYQSAVTEPLPWSEAQRTRPIWLAVSAHPEEYDLLFAAHDHLQAREPTALMVIAPRHPVSSRAWAPKRFAPVFFSDGHQPKDDTGLFVMDAFGHVPQLHLLSHVSFIGGSLGKRGGHSPWEAARAGSYILTGPDIANNAPAYNGLAHEIITTPNALADAVCKAWAAPRPAPILRSAKNSQTTRAVLDMLQAQC
ncbi:3-deoxy-D-manno-octulosonic acid transferase [Roseibaca calidilacus]|nr:glycosyltransferase N-terminal domain-containing protein [Roseibaca calidilacus]